MTPIERVRRDHTLFKTKLGVLETALAFGEDAQFVVREISLTFARQLREHSRRESQLALAASRTLRSVDSQTLERLAVDHGEERRLLHVVNLLAAQPMWPAEDVRAALSACIATCRMRMTEQESQLFPLFQDVLGSQSSFHARHAAEPAPVVDTMTGSEVVQRYPQTRAVFERFFIDIDREGYHGLDELAWRHHLPNHQLITELRRSISGIEVPQVS